MVERIGIEPMTPCVQGRCSPSWANTPSRLLNKYIMQQIALSMLFLIFFDKMINGIVSITKESLKIKAILHLQGSFVFIYMLYHLIKAVFHIKLLWITWSFDLILYFLQCMTVNIRLKICSICSAVRYTAAVSGYHETWFPTVGFEITWAFHSAFLIPLFPYLSTFCLKPFMIPSSIPSSKLSLKP